MHRHPRLCRDLAVRRARGQMGEISEQVRCARRIDLEFLEAVEKIGKRVETGIFLIDRHPELFVHLVHAPQMYENGEDREPDADKERRH